jgi:hypothetical protein
VAGSLVRDLLASGPQWSPLRWRLRSGTSRGWLLLRLAGPPAGHGPRAGVPALALPCVRLMCGGPGSRCSRLCLPRPACCPSRAGGSLLAHAPPLCPAGPCWPVARHLPGCGDSDGFWQELPSPPLPRPRLGPAAFSRLARPRGWAPRCCPFLGSLAGGHCFPPCCPV